MEVAKLWTRSFDTLYLSVRQHDVHVADGSTGTSSIPADLVDRGRHLPLGQRELSTQGSERGGEATTQPGLDPRRLDDGPTKSVGHESVSNENCKRHRHEHAAQDQQLCERRGCARFHELRQESEEED